MDLLLLRVFQRQVELQCKAIVFSGHDLQLAMSVNDKSRTWVAVQNLLSAAANASKALWGQGSRFASKEPIFAQA